MKGAEQLEVIGPVRPAPGERNYVVDVLPWGCTVGALAALGFGDGAHVGWREFTLSALLSTAANLLAHDGIAWVGCVSLATLRIYLFPILSPPFAKILGGCSCAMFAPLAFPLLARGGIGHFFDFAPRDPLRIVLFAATGTFNASIGIGSVADGIVANFARQPKPHAFTRRGCRKARGIIRYCLSRPIFLSNPACLSNFRLGAMTLGTPLRHLRLMGGPLSDALGRLCMFSPSIPASYSIALDTLAR